MRTVIEYKGKTLTIEGLRTEGDNKAYLSVSKVIYDCHQTTIEFGGGRSFPTESLIAWGYIVDCLASGVEPECFYDALVKTMVIR